MRRAVRVAGVESGLALANPIERALGDLIAVRRARIGVIGLGSTGLPLACTFAEGGFPVLGFDADPDRLAALSRGESYLRHVAGMRIASLAMPLDALLAPEPVGGRLAITADLDHLRACDVIVVCGQASGDADLRAVSRVLRGRQLVVVEATMPPGGADQAVRPLLERCALSVGREVFLAVSSDPGDRESSRFTKRVGGLTPACTRLAAALYRMVVERPVVVWPARTGEPVVIRARGVDPGLADGLEVIRTAMPVRVLHKLIEALERRGTALHGARVLVLGIARRRDVRDTRESPALELLGMLRDHGARVAYHDPFVPAVGRVRSHRFDLRSIPLTAEALRRADATVVATDHSSFDGDFIVRHARLVVDTRDLTRGVRGGRDRVVHV